MEAYSGFKMMMMGVERRAQRDERAAVLRYLRVERDLFRKLAKDAGRNRSKDLYAFMEAWLEGAGYALQWIATEIREQLHLGGTHVDSEGSPKTGGLRREGGEAEQATNA